MSSVRFLALVATQTPPVTTVQLVPSPAAESSLATISAGGIFTRASRGGTPRRELLWISDLTGEQIGVVS